MKLSLLEKLGLLILFTICLSYLPAGARIVEDINQVAVRSIAKTSPFVQSKVSAFDIHVINDSMSSVKDFHYLGKQVEGITEFHVNQLYVSNLDFKNRTTESTLYHEIGHTLDGKKGNEEFGEYSLTPKFKAIMQEECKSLKPLANEAYFTTKPEEYFAESFSIYMENPDKMKKLAPKTYKYINKIVKQPVDSNSK